MVNKQYRDSSAAIVARKLPRKQQVLARPASVSKWRLGLGHQRFMNFVEVNNTLQPRNKAVDHCHRSSKARLAARSRSNATYAYEGVDMCKCVVDVHELRILGPI